MLFFLLHEKYIDLTKLVNNNNIELFKLLYELEIDLKYKELFTVACEKNQFEFVKWLHQIINVEIPEFKADTAFYFACIKNQLQIAKWLLLNYNIQQNSDFRYIFPRVCELGFLEMAQWLYSNFNIDIHVLDEYAFRNACQNGHLEIVIWLLEIDNNIKLDIRDNNTFVTSCGKGHLDIAQLIYLKTTNNISDVHILDAFQKACCEGHLQIAIWLFSINNILELASDWNNLFVRVCAKGYYNMARWLFEHIPNIQISYRNYVAYVYAIEVDNMILADWLCGQDNNCMYSQEAFLVVCRYGKLKLAQLLYSKNNHDQNIISYAFLSSIKEGQLEIVKWLFEISKLDLTGDKFLYFRTACEYGQLEIAQWLYLCGSDIRAYDDYAFVRANRGHHIKVVKWLLGLCIDYYADIHENTIIEYGINNRLHMALYLLEKNDIGKIINLFRFSRKNELIQDWCNVCYEQINLIRTKCKHYICLECFIRWYLETKTTHNFQCVICRGYFEFEDCTALI